MNSQYQHLAESLNRVHVKLELLSSNLDGLTSRVSEMEKGTKVMIPEQKPPLPQPLVSNMRSYCIFGPSSTTLDISEDFKNIEGSMIFVTLVGGGGSGSVGSTSMSGMLSGAGGGAGETIHRRIISLAGCTGKLMITAGGGGNESSPNGGDSSIEPEMEDNSRVKITAKGGASGHNQFGGAGALSSIYPVSSVFDGQNGKDGVLQSSPGQSTVEGGAGGNSYFAQGGRGGYSYFIKDSFDRTILSPKGEDGTYGSGGGGSIPGISKDFVSKGGDGMVIIEYTLSELN